LLLTTFWKARRGKRSIENPSKRLMAHESTGLHPERHKEESGAIDSYVLLTEDEGVRRGEAV
jgi:hypothetical protein